MNEITRDPVHRARYSFRRDGENLIVDTWLEPGGGLPKHFHPVQEERWQVLEGRVKFHLEGIDRILTPEDGVVVVSPGMKHSLESIEAAEAHLRCEAVPGLGLEDFLTDSAEAARRGLFRKGGIPASLEGARWAAGFLGRHRDETVMTFPPQFAQRAMIALFSGSPG
ncbi:MAG: cupin domain-containing protein [Solirubrobacterales bacterium]|nr:cupin domain-containing protein [Solirubrobacterales bacterium]